MSTPQPPSPASVLVPTLPQPLRPLLGVPIGWDPRTAGQGDGTVPCVPMRGAACPRCADAAAGCSGACTGGASRGIYPLIPLPGLDWAALAAGGLFKGGRPPPSSCWRSWGGGSTAVGPLGPLRPPAPRHEQPWSWGATVTLQGLGGLSIPPRLGRGLGSPASPLPVPMVLWPLPPPRVSLPLWAHSWGPHSSTAWVPLAPQPGLYF